MAILGANVSRFPRGCLQFVIVVFPDHTHLIFIITVSDPVNTW